MGERIQHYRLKPEEAAALSNAIGAMLADMGALPHVNAVQGGDLACTDSQRSLMLFALSRYSAPQGEEEDGPRTGVAGNLFRLLSNGRHG